MLNEKQQKERSALEVETIQKYHEALSENNYQIVTPFLKRVVDMHKLEASNISGFDNPYDVALYKFEDGGLTVRYLDDLFGELYSGIKKILNKLGKSTWSDEADVLPEMGTFDMKKLQEVSEYAARTMAFDFSKGVNAHIEVPYTSLMGPNESRISSDYRQFSLGFFVTLHEMGHGIYGYSSPRLEGTGLWSGHMGSLHESQARFYENILGKTPQFMKFMYPKFQKQFDCFNGITLDNFVRSILKVKPILRRIKSDEITYNLHIIIRDEMEKMMMLQDGIDFNELNEIWNDLYEKYLGIKPLDDMTGILQDPHWYYVGMGYFPAYAVGNIYSGQFRNSMLKELPDTYEMVEKGEFDLINKWLLDNIHQYGKIYKSQDVLRRVTGEEANAKYLLRYLEQKYDDVFIV